MNLFSTNKLPVNRRSFLKTSAFAREDSAIIRLRYGARLNILFA